MRRWGCVGLLLFALTDGTVLQGRITAETLAVNTSVGQVIELPVAELKTMHREKDTPVVPVTHGDIFELHSGEVIVGARHACR